MHITDNSTFKMKPADVELSTYILFGIENNHKDPIFKIGDHVTISNYKHIFGKGYISNWSEEVLRGYILLVVFMVKKLLERFMNKNGKKTNQTEFRVEKVIKRKGDKVYVKWKGCDNSFSDWIDKKRHAMTEYFPKLKPLGEWESGIRFI